MVVLGFGFIAFSSAATEKVTHLFTDWYGVEAGTTLFRVNLMWPEFVRHGSLLFLFMGLVAG